MAKKQDVQTVTFNLIKSKYFRVIHVDGAYGGLTPGQYIHMTVYSERMAIPQETTREILANGSLGNEIVSKSREGVVRELEADLIFNETEAIALRDWLEIKIEALRSLRESN